MKTVKYFDNVNDAAVALSFLESEGIEAVILNENLSSVTPIAFANPSMRPYLAVCDEDYARAAELLGVAAEEDVRVCPNCGSAKVRYGITNRKSGRKRAIKLMFVVLSLVGGGALGNVTACRYCGDCNKEF